MSAQHTRGPWEACEPGDYGDFDGHSRVVLGDDMRIAVVHWHPTLNRDECDANARLIAVAPELLAALTEIVGILRHNPEASEPPRYRNARASKVAADAIAKATGAA